MDAEGFQLRVERDRLKRELGDARAERDRLEADLAAERTNIEEQCMKYAAPFVQDVVERKAECERLEAEAAAMRGALNISLDGNRPVSVSREWLGRKVREVWVRWANQQPTPKPHWLVGWDDLPEPDREVDRQIGEEIARWALIYDAASRSIALDALPTAGADLLARLERAEAALTKIEALPKIYANAHDTANWAVQIAHNYRAALAGKEPPA